jgi:hypothetical protein
VQAILVRFQAQAMLLFESFRVQAHQKTVNKQLTFFRLLRLLSKKTFGVIVTEGATLGSFYGASITIGKIAILGMIRRTVVQFVGV